MRFAVRHDTLYRSSAPMRLARRPRRAGSAQDHSDQRRALGRQGDVGVALWVGDCGGVRSFC